MPLKIPQQDRIENRYTVLNPQDKTILNADNIMLIFDNLINGQYTLKPAKQYATYTALQAETEIEQGQTAYVLEEAYKNVLFIYNGTQWIVIGSNDIDYSIKQAIFDIPENETEILTNLDLENVISYMVFLNGLKIEEDVDYHVSTTNNISTIILNETNEGIITVVYQ